MVETIEPSSITLEEQAQAFAYFRGQQENPCTHYFPDVLTLLDQKIGEKYFRTLNCLDCGNYQVQMDNLDPKYRARLDTNVPIKIFENLEALQTRRELERNRLEQR